jgi:replicative DNA helicase
MPGERIPPHNLDAEQSLLGACLIERDAIVRIADTVKPEDFYRQAHADIFGAMAELFNRHEPIDVLTLANVLLEHGRLEAVGGRAYLMELTTVVPTAANIMSYAGIIQKKATLRRLTAVASEIADLSFAEDEEADDLLDRAERSVMSVSQNFTRTNFVSLESVLEDAFERMDDLQKNRGKLRGIPTGFKDLDSLLGGLQKSDLVVLAARPSVGKTSFALDIARLTAVKHKNPVGIFSLEMSKDQLVDRMLCAESGVNLWNMRTGNLDEHGPEDSDYTRIGHAMGSLAEAPIFIDDTPSLNIMQVRAKARRLKMELGDKGLGLIIIDYLQLMESRGSRSADNRVQEVAEITRALKGLARELNCPVLALSQLSRAVEQSKPAIPKLSHLRESGSIEQDADVVMFIYRKASDRNYRLDEIPLDDRRTAEIIVAKHRNGPTGDIRLFFDDGRTSFRDLETRHNSPESAPAPAHNH